MEDRQSVGRRRGGRQGDLSVLRVTRKGKARVVVGNGDNCRMAVKSESSISVYYGRSHDYCACGHFSRNRSQGTVKQNRGIFA